MLIQTNRFSGTFEMSYVPRGLKELDISDNQFSGTFNFATLPPSLEVLNVMNNQFSGTVNISPFPSSLKAINFQSNRFNGPIDLSLAPQKIAYYILRDNKFCGAVKTGSRGQNCIKLGFVVINMCAKGLTPNGTCEKGDMFCPPCNPKTRTKSHTLTVYKQTRHANGSNISSLNVETSGTIIPTTSQAVIASSTFVSPDVAIVTQMLVLSRCHGDAASSSSSSSSTSLRRPVLSWGRVFDVPSNTFIDVELWEGFMLLITLTSLYVLHGVILLVGICRSRSKNSTKPYIHSVNRFGYPGNTTRYHISMTVTMTSLIVYGMCSSLAMTLLITFVYFGPLVSIHVLILYRGNTLRYVTTEQTTNPTSSRWLTLERYWLLPRGLWSPRTASALGGPFYASYTHVTIPSLRVGISPHVWVWVTLVVGVCMSVLTSVVEIQGGGRQPCSVGAIISGVVVMCCGIVHVTYFRELMSVRMVCLVRGVRLFVNGLTMIVLGSFVLMDVEYSDDDESHNVTTTVLFMLSLGVSAIETTTVSLHKIFLFVRRKKKRS
eukprot:PhF_6_TR31791/c1_g1_i18/m.46854